MKTFALVALALSSLTVAACGGGDDTSDDSTDTPAIDAPSGTDAPHADAPHADAPPDSPSGAACTGALYDPCTTNADCTASGGMCKTFNGSGFSVCTTTCGTCPTQNGAAVQCNGMGICKPSAPNNCTRP